MRNRGELAEGWYDPATFKKAVEGAYNRDSPKASGHRAYGRRSSPTYTNDEKRSSSLNETRSRLDDGRLSIEQDDDDKDDDDEDSYGPQAPVPHHQSLSRKSGPKIPTMADLTLKRGSLISLFIHSPSGFVQLLTPLIEDEQLDLEESRRVNRAARKQELNAHKSELRKIEDEIAPRAEPGSRERLLEKKREKSASNRAYAEARGGSPVDGVADADLMGGAEGEDGFKQMKEKQMRKKNERELRKEEILRARAEEREVRLRSYRRKEDETMDYLRAIAQERFG